jgi:hypothetical protein
LTYIEEISSCSPPVNQAYSPSRDLLIMVSTRNWPGPGETSRGE